MKKLITYDLNIPGQRYADLYAAIKELGDWIHPLQNTWVVNSSLTCSEIVQTLSSKAHLDSNDKIFVTLVEYWATNFSNSDTDWLKTN